MFRSIRECFNLFGIIGSAPNGDRTRTRLSWRDASGGRTNEDECSKWLCQMSIDRVTGLYIKISRYGGRLDTRNNMGVVGLTRKMEEANRADTH